MMRFAFKKSVRALAYLGLLSSATLSAMPAHAQEDSELRERIEKMEAELRELRARLDSQQASTPESGNIVQTSPSWQRPTVMPQDRSDILVHFAGYADTSLRLFDDQEASDATFVAGAFNPAVHVQYRDLLVFETEAEIGVGANGETDFELEYSQVDILVHDNATLVLGKFLSPVGQFQERLHPSWINRLADPPAGFGHGGVQPGSEVGLQIRGGVPLGRSRFVYALAVGNGPRLDGMGGVMTEGSGGEDNSNKAISGRVGFLPLPYLEIGASLLTARVNGPSGGEPADTHGAFGGIVSVAAVGAQDADLGDLSGLAVDYDLWGLDAAYTRGPWDARFEYLKGVRDAFIIEDHDGELDTALDRLEMEAWYAQLAYRLSGVTDHPIISNFEPVARYGEYNISGSEELAEESAEERWDVGINYWFAPSFVLHSALQRRIFTARHDDEDRRDTRLLLQLSYGF